MGNITSQLNDLLSGNDLIKALSSLPCVCTNLNSKKDRLIALLDIYKIYIPNKASVEIYNTLYLSILNSLEKKETIEEVELINSVGRNRSIKKYGVIGGLDSYRITGLPGVGKSATISRIIDVICSGKVLANHRFKREIIPALVVECPADGSFKSLLYSILQQIDLKLDSNYFALNSGKNITTDYLLNVVSIVLINHVGVLIIDEIERVANDSSRGITLINYLTQLINQTNVGICFVGNEIANTYFAIKEYLGRRTVGVSVNHLEYDEFADFCEVLFDYQYTYKKLTLNNGFIQSFYKLTNGIPALIVGLFVEAQKFAIINDISSISVEIMDKILNSMFANMLPHLENKKKNSVGKNKVKDDNILVFPKQRHNKESEEVIHDIFKISYKDTDLFVNLLSKRIKVETIHESKNID